jgi:glycosyltransferase involved in cell wall biosynthesis
MSDKQSELLSVVTPVYNEEASLGQYRDAVKETLLALPNLRVEVILVDDGSVDGSWGMIESMCAADQRFRGLRLSRNFGSHAALTAGIVAARGDAVATLASDLQDPPQVILEFIEKWRAGAQIVWGRRRKREDKGWRVLASNLFFRLIRRYAMPRGSQFTTGSFFLIDRRVVDCFRQFPERNRITFALVAWTGFRQDAASYDRKSRVAGSTGWTFARMLKSMYDTFIGFSDVPARLMTILGVATFVLTIPFGIYLVLDWLLTDTVPGWTGLMLGMSVFFGLQFLMMGLVGEYLYRIYTEVSARPLYFISNEAGMSNVSKE